MITTSGNISVWRGLDAPPSQYHLWVQEDVSKNYINTFIFNDNKWELLFSGSKQFFQLVTSLPIEGEEDVIYVIPIIDGEGKVQLDSYIWVNDAWEHLGILDIDVDIDLSNYYTKTEVDNLLIYKANQVQVTALANALDELGLEVDSHESKITVLQTDVETISDQILDLVEDINILETEKQNKLVAGDNITLTPVVGSDYLIKIDANGLIDIFDTVSALPLIGEENIIYFVLSNSPTTQNLYDEFVWINNNWEKLGNLDIDLTNYYTKSEINLLLGAKANQSELDALETVVNNVQISLNNKVDKIPGKGLSTEDYTTIEKNKLAGIAAGAEVNVQSDWNQTNIGSDDFIKNKPSIPTKISDLIEDTISKTNITVTTDTILTSLDPFEYQQSLILIKNNGANPISIIPDTTYGGLSVINLADDTEMVAPDSYALVDFTKMGSMLTFRKWVSDTIIPVIIGDYMWSDAVADTFPTQSAVENGMISGNQIEFVSGFTQTFKNSDRRIIVAYPASMGNLREILNMGVQDIRSFTDKSQNPDGTYDPLIQYTINGELYNIYSWYTVYIWGLTLTFNF